MDIQGECTCGPGGARMIYACSGGSNVGQIANEAAKELTAHRFGKFHCLAGIGGDVGKMGEAAAAADERVVNDGCPVQCAKKILDARGLVMDRYVVITDLGIQNPPDLCVKQDNVLRIVNAVLSTCR